MKLIDLTDPFFRPPLVRIAVVGVAVGWGLFEFATGAPFWGMAFVGIGAVVAWRFSTIDYGPPE